MKSIGAGIESTLRNQPPYNPPSIMDTLFAFARGESNRHKPLMVFDWDKAARLIKESGVTEASAGLAGDWDYIGGEILREGKPYMDGYTYLASTWAQPELRLGYGMEQECWKFQSDTPEWDAQTKWPESALTILRG